jgi:hypothetical protein
LIHMSATAATTDRPSAVAMALSPTIPAHVAGVSWS